MVKKVIEYFIQRKRRKKFKKVTTMLDAHDRQRISTTRKHLYTDDDVLSVL